MKYFIFTILTVFLYATESFAKDEIKKYNKISRNIFSIVEELERIKKRNKIDDIINRSTNHVLKIYNLKKERINKCKKLLKIKDEVGILDLIQHQIHSPSKSKNIIEISYLMYSVDELKHKIISMTNQPYQYKNKDTIDFVKNSQIWSFDIAVKEMISNKSNSDELQFFLMMKAAKNGVVLKKKV